MRVSVCVQKEERKVKMKVLKINCVSSCNPLILLLQSHSHTNSKSSHAKYEYKQHMHQDTNE